MVGFGAYLDVAAVENLWFVWKQPVAPPGVMVDFSYIQIQIIGNMTLEGWQIYVFVGLLFVVGTACILLGLSWLTKSWGGKGDHG